MKRYVRSASNLFKHPLMEYIPRLYRPYVTNIYRGEKEWNDVTQRWNQPVIVEWTVDGETEEEEFQNAAYMKELLKEFGRDIIDNLLARHNIQL